MVGLDVAAQRGAHGGHGRADRTIASTVANRICIRNG
jgi:hypothetical protein